MILIIIVLEIGLPVINFSLSLPCLKERKMLWLYNSELAVMDLCVKCDNIDW